VRQTDPDGVTTLYTYNGKGEREVTCVDVNKNGVIDYAGPDRITKTTRSIVSDHGTMVRRSLTSVYAGDNSAAPTVTTMVDQSLDGLIQWQTQLGQTSVSAKTYNGPGAWTLTAWNPDGTSRVQTYDGGRLVAEMLQDNNGAPVAWSSHSYDDPFGRLSSRTDSRTGTTSFTYDLKGRTLTSSREDCSDVGTLTLLQ